MEEYLLLFFFHQIARYVSYSAWTEVVTTDLAVMLLQAVSLSSYVAVAWVSQYVTGEYLWHNGLLIQ